MADYDELSVFAAETPLPDPRPQEPVARARSAQPTVTSGARGQRTTMGAGRAVLLGALWLAAIPTTALILTEMSSPAPVAAEPIQPTRASSRPADAAQPHQALPYISTTSTAETRQALERVREPAAELVPAPPAARPKPRTSRTDAAPAAPRVVSRSDAEPDRSGEAPALPMAYRGGLVIDSQPEAARVFLNGRDVGATPLTLDNVPAGSHVVRIAGESHQTWSGVVRVVADEQTRLGVLLKTAPNR